MKKHRSPWQRMALSLIGIAIIAGMWRWSVFHLYTLPVHTIAAFTSLTTNAFYVVAAIVIFMVTGRLIYDWKNTTTATVLQEGKTLLVEKRRVDPKDIDDGTIP